FVFLAVMFYYAPLLTWIVLGAFPFYIAISAGATPLFRRRLDEKFRRGAENQAFLVESVNGVETLKAMAVEPQMQQRWEEQLAGSHEFILEMPEAYDTIIGERGSSLSGGQRQRIAIARALVMDPRILIFDEATSALDYASERVIQANMQQIAHGRTVFIIAHRLSTVRHTHRILTIDRGRLVEDGTHHELVRTGGRYAMLH